MTYELRYERDFDASDADVFDAFTSVEGQRAMFWSDDPDWIFHSDIDFRVGGVWRVESGLPQEELYRFTHTFQAIERPRLIRLTVTEVLPAVRHMTPKRKLHSTITPAGRL
jgi:uncharacterized protein YndB with AHSA1/START domain